MDYGHTTDNNEKQFFTEGAGTDSIDVNDVEPENNLELNNEIASWSTTPGRDPRNMGNSAIISSNEKLPSSNTDHIVVEQNQEINLEMPPNDKNNTTPSKSLMNPETNDQSLSADIAEIKTEERLNASGIAEMDTAIDAFKNTGDAASFYKSARKLMEKNLENSYDRKLAE